MDTLVQSVVSFGEQNKNIDVEKQKWDFQLHSRNYLPKIAVEYSDGGNDCPAQWKQVHCNQNRQKTRVFVEACRDTKIQPQDQEEKTSGGLRVLDNGQQSYYIYICTMATHQHINRVSTWQAVSLEGWGLCKKQPQFKTRSSNDSSDSVNGFNFTWNARRSGKKAGVASKNNHDVARKRCSVQTRQMHA